MRRSCRKRRSTASPKSTGATSRRRGWSPIPAATRAAPQLPLIPLIKAKAIDLDEIVIDAKSGMTGAGRAAKEAMLFSEVSEGFNAYGVGNHRHMAELDQEFSLAAGREVVVTFTPHLVPMNRGILSTIYVRGKRGRTPQDLHAILLKFYAKEPFVHVLPFGETPQTRHVRGSNMTMIGVAADRIPGRAIVDLGARQSGEGRLRPGDPEHEPDAGLSGDHGHRSGRAVSLDSSWILWPVPLPGDRPCSRSPTSRRRSSPIICSPATPCCARRCGARSAEWAEGGLNALGETLGKPETVKLGFDANRIPPQLRRRSTATATGSTRSSFIRPGMNCWRSRCAPACIRALGGAASRARMSRAPPAPTCSTRSKAAFIARWR